MWVYNPYPAKCFNIRSAGRSTSGVKLLNLNLNLNLDPDDRIAAAVAIPPEEPKTNGDGGTLLQ